MNNKPNPDDRSDNVERIQENIDETIHNMELAEDMIAKTDNPQTKEDLLGQKRKAQTGLGWYAQRDQGRSRRQGKRLYGLNCSVLKRAVRKGGSFVVENGGRLLSRRGRVIIFISPLWGYERRRTMETYPHRHNHQDTKKVIDRLSRAIGHLEAVKKMVEDGRDCSEVLIQLSAVQAAINNTGKIILRDHINHCVVDAVKTGDQQVLDDLNQAIDKFVK